MFISIPSSSEIGALMKNCHCTHAGSEVRSPIELQTVASSLDSKSGSPCSDFKVKS